jgi:NCAIR mutase (PurE)-related protein
MKLTIIKEEPKKKFEPIKMEMTLETPDEVRLMWHALNRNNLKKAIFCDGYSMESYNPEIEHSLGGYSDDTELIRRELEKQGLSI